MREAEVESLESRRLLFAAVDPSTNQLVIVGTSKNDHIQVEMSGGTLLVTRNGEARRVEWPELGPVVVNSFRGNDAVRILTGNPVTVNAAAGNDVVFGGGNRIIAFGAEGNDTLYGSGKSKDHLIGGPGDDYLDGGRGSDGVFGDNYDVITQIPDSAVPAQGNDTIIGGPGTDLMQGQGGNDLFYGGANEDFIEAGAGNDTLYGGAGDDRLGDGPGDDHIFGEAEGGQWGRAADVNGIRLSLDGIANDGGPGESDNVNGVWAVTGTDGPDFIDFSNAERGTYFDALGGVDTVIGSPFADNLYGDSVLAGGGDDTVIGSDASDVACTLVGGTGNDELIGGGGNDVIEGNAGNDTVYASSGNDTIFGQRGVDHIEAETGDDVIYGGPDAADKILGGEGNDSAAKDDKDTYEDVETLLA